MKKYKGILRVLAAVLCAVMLLGTLTGCGSSDEKGAYINIYLGAEVRSWDPAIGFTDSAAVKYFSLVYEGLTKYDDNGKVINADAKNIEVKTNSDGELYMEIDIDGDWSDGRPVSANDYIYSFKRILDPDFSSPAKSLLYPIKNARKIINGECTIDDLCIYAPMTKTLQIFFEDPNYDTDSFLENLASLALVPVREDMVAVYDNWDKIAIDIQTNGPFTVKTMDTTAEGGQLILERNKYYQKTSHNIFLNDSVLTKYITPYRLVVNYGYKDKESDTTYDQVMGYADREEAFNYDGDSGEAITTSGGVTLDSADDQIFYLSNLRGDTELKKVKTSELMSTYCYYFNTNKAPFDKAEVRQALSMAIDREAIAALYYGAVPATGFVPHAVTYSSRKNTFREEVGEILNVAGDIDGAKALLKSAGVSSGSFTLTYRDINRNGEIAEAVKAAWEQLGFKVKLEGLDYEDYMQRMTLYVEGVSNVFSKEVENEETGLNETKYYMVEKEEGKLIDADSASKNGTDITDQIVGNNSYALKEKSEEPNSYYDFDVIGLDYQSLNADPFYTLAPFAPDYSGNAVMTQYNDYESRTHMTGYNSNKFNELIDQAYAAATREEAAPILAEAEKQLLQDMPVCPVIFNTDSYVIGSGLSKCKFTTAYGNRDFSKAKLKNYMNYYPASELELLNNENDEK